MNIDDLPKDLDETVRIMSKRLSDGDGHISTQYEALKNDLNKNHGYISGLFLFFYGIFRFTIEFLREPDAHIGLIFNLLSHKLFEVFQEHHLLGGALFINFY